MYMFVYIFFIYIYIYIYIYFFFFFSPGELLRDINLTSNSFGHKILAYLQDIRGFVKCLVEIY